MANRQDNHRTTLTVDNVVVGAFESKTGGDSDSNIVTWQQAGMAGQISLGGPAITAAVVLQGLETDHMRSLEKWLRSRSGKGVATVTEQVLDDEGFPLGDPIVYQGVLKRYKGSDRNSNSNTAAVAEAEIDINGIPT